MTTGAPVPRTELVHHLHSPKYYPRNCTQNCWGGRNCPAVITSGDLKLMLGYVGDPRRLTMNESTGGARVPFGATGGECGLAGFAGEIYTHTNTTRHMLLSFPPLTPAHPAWNGVTVCMLSINGTVSNACSRSVANESDSSNLDVVDVSAPSS